jgi:hypothetical protein
MAQKIYVLAVIALGLALNNARADDPSLARPRVATLMRTKLETARMAFTEVWGGPWTDVEVPYRWSSRWLEVELQLSDKTEGRIAAFKGHLARVKEMARASKSLSLQRLIPFDQVKAAEFYVAEAEAWLGQAASEQPVTSTRGPGSEKEYSAQYRRSRTGS